MNQTLDVVCTNNVDYVRTKYILITILLVSESTSVGDQTWMCHSE